MWSKASKFDVVYRKLLLTKFFTKGWGSPDTLRRIFELGKILSDRSTCQELVDDNYPITIVKDEVHRGCRIMEGHFHSPFANFLPDLMPQEVQTARFQMVLPLVWRKRAKPICIHLAGTGDHHFWRRRVLAARPLVKEYGIGSLLLENPYYGNRKPKDQLHSSLNNVSDLFVMGGALILESLTLLHWCKNQGYGPLGLTGVSMGGHMATLAATNWPEPIPLIPCLSWSSATPVFTEGVLSGAIPWNLLATQYVCQAEYEKDILKKMLKCPQTDAFGLGQEFAINYPESFEDLKNVHFRKGLAKIHKFNMKNTTQEESSQPKECNEKLGTKTGETVSAESKRMLKEDQLNLCNEKASTPLTNTVHSSNHVISEKSTITGSTDVPKVSPSSGLIKECTHQETLDIGILQQNQPRMLKGSDEAAKKVLFDSDALGFITNHSVEVSAKRCSLQQNLTRSKLDDEFLKETSNIPVLENYSNQSIDAEMRKGQPLQDTLPKNTNEQQSRDTKSKGYQRSQQVKRSSNIKGAEFVSVKEEAMEFMHGVMDAATFLGNFSIPVDSSLVVVVTARQDGYVPRDNVPSLQDLWPGIEVRYLNSGHVRAILFMQHHFRKAINDAFTKYMIKYPEEY